MQRMPTVQYVYCGDQYDVAGERRNTGGDQQGIDREFTVFGGTAVSLGTKPLGKTEGKIEAGLFRLHDQFRVIVEGPVRIARCRRDGPATILNRQKQAQYERLALCALKRAQPVPSR